MNYTMSRLLILLFCVFTAITTYAQKVEVPIGEWRIHLPYNAVNSIAESPNFLYVGAERGFYSYHKKSGEMALYSKVNGFSDVEVQKLKYHDGLNLLFIAYENTNIDILQGNSIFNISDVLRKPILGLKTINDIHFEGNFAYLSCSFGIVIIDLVKKAVSDSYLNIGPNGIATPINSLTFYRDSIFAGTPIGILKAPIAGKNLSDFNSWEGPIQMPNNDISDEARLLRVFKDKIYCEVDQRMRVYDGNKWIFKGDTTPQYKRDTRSIEICHGNLVYVQVPLRPEISPGITVIDENGIERFYRENVNNFAILDFESSIWTGGDFTGLVKIDKDGLYSFTKPNGPQRSTAFSMTPIGDEMWVAGGGTSAQWNPIFSNAGFYRFQDGRWKNRLDIPEIELAYDVLTIASDQSGSDVFVGSHGFGLIHLRNNQLVDIYTDQNSILTKSQGGYVQADGLAYDSEGNIWISNYDSDQALKVRTPQGKWNAYELPTDRITEIIIDDFDQKWMVSRDLSVGLVVFKETEGVLSSTNELHTLQNSVGNGSLPSNEVNALVLDHDGEIW
ncbi:MAG: hypothetical protein ACI9UJ_000717, partial [bacterium]